MGYKLNQPIRLSALADELSLEWGGIDILVKGVSPSSSAVSSDITFSRTALEKVEGIALITEEVLSDSQFNVNGFINTDNPRLVFIKILTFLNERIGFSTWNTPAVIHPTAQIGKNVVIEDGCTIGADTIIEHNTVLHTGTRVGNNTRIRSCSSIGGDGFGFERLDDGTSIRFPHLGGVVIGENVEIGALNSIARGTLSDTIIERNVKTDNLVHIAHNCQVGSGTLMTACAELSGGVILGKDTWVGPNASVVQKVTTGCEAFIGIGAVVTKDVPSGATVAGNPARKIKSV